jgi:hypothetical protein
MLNILHTAAAVGAVFMQRTPDDVTCGCNRDSHLSSTYLNGLNKKKAPSRRSKWPFGPMLQSVVPLDDQTLPSARNARDVLLIVGFIALLLLLGLLLWAAGPLPRIFPLMTS